MLDVITRRLAQLLADPSMQPWLLRAIGLRHTGTMVGHIGFHARPGADYLRELAPGGVEFGYTIFAPFRRRGYAREACRALMDWARREHGVTRFVVSIGPTNVASIALAQQLGFRRIGSHIDEVDGPEQIFERRVD
jgi:RimJ/RimL family protein N-acetyltransferase